MSKCLSEESLEWLPSKVCCAQNNMEREIGPDTGEVSKRIETMLSKMLNAGEGGVGGGGKGEEAETDSADVA